jgi:hypothetical protein
MVNLKENNYQLRLIYPTKLSFIIEEEIKTFYNKQKLKEFRTTKPAQQKKKEKKEEEEEKPPNSKIAGRKK